MWLPSCLSPAFPPTSKDIVYVLSSKAASKVDDSDAGVYYEYKAVVNGEITTAEDG